MLKLEKRHRRLFMAILIVVLVAVSSLKLDVLGSVVTAVATGVIAYFTRTLWRTNENQLAHARTSDRAYLSGGGDIEDRDSRQFFRFDVENHGKTPAFTIAYDVQFAKLEELRGEYPKARDVCKAVDIRTVGRELGVRYVLEGGVRKAGNQLRITGQLVDTGSGAHIWANRFDGPLDDVFDLQDRVSMAVAGVVEPTITQAEIERVSHKPSESLLAYDWLLRAIGEEQLSDRPSIERGIAFARHAIDLDPRFARAHAYLARWLNRCRLYGWTSNVRTGTSEAIEFAYRAVRLDPNDPTVLTEAAFALAHLNSDLATAIPWLDRSIALNPNSASAFGMGALVRNMAGDYALAAEHVERAIRLSPFDPHMTAFMVARGMSHLLRRQLPEAVQWMRKAIQIGSFHSPAFLCLASSLAHSGQIDEARIAIRRLLELNPMSSMSWIRRRYPVLPKGDYEYPLEGARLAGLPE
jgi:tetratricopeptide (TPR) repeat protein